MLRRVVLPGNNVRHFFTIVLLILSCTAQEPAPASSALQGRLDKALQKMTGLERVEFSSELQKSSALHTAMRRKPQKELVQVKFFDGSILATLRDKDELLITPSGWLARHDGQAWKRRPGRLANGERAPFVFHPQLFFAELANASPKVVQAEVGSYEDRPIEVLSLELDESASRELLFAGAIPDQTAEATVVAGAGAVLTTKLTVDLALFVDPASGVVRRIRLRILRTDDFAVAGGMVFIGGAAVRGVALGGEEPEEENEEEEGKPPEKPTFKDGLRVRKQAKGEAPKHALDLDIKLTGHDSMTPPEIDAQALKLLHSGRSTHAPADKK